MTDVRQADTAKLDTAKLDTATVDGGRADTATVAGAKVDAGGVASKGGGPPTAAPSPARPTGRKAEGRDPRDLALRNFALSITVFNILGYTVLGFEQPWMFPFLALALGYSLEIGIEMLSAWAGHRPTAWHGRGAWGVYTFLLPAHITSLVVNMLLYANTRFWAVAFGVVIGVGAKAVLRAPIKGRFKHFMNPSNFGVSVALLVFPWISIAPPYQFTENVPDVFRVMVPMIVLTAGTILNATLTRKVPLIVGWVGGFVIQALIRYLIWDVALFSALSVMTGVAFVLFTNYMITDPGTSPFPPRAQFMFGSAVAMVYGALMAFNIVYGLFFAVTIVCAGRGAYWWVRWLRQRRQDRKQRAGSSAELGRAVTT